MAATSRAGASRGRVPDRLPPGPAHSADMPNANCEPRPLLLSIGVHLPPIHGDQRTAHFSLVPGDKGQLISPSGGSPRGREGFCRRSEEHTSELQSLMRISYAVFCLKKKKKLRIKEST